MPDFDTRRPQDQNVPNEPRNGLVANKLRTALMATRLRTLLMGGGSLLFVVAVPVGLLIYSPSWLGDQDPGSSQGSSQREVGSSQQTSEPTDIASVGRCADKGSTVGQQEEAPRNEVSNAKIAFVRANLSLNSDIYVIDEEGTHETRLAATQWTENGPAWSPDGEKIAFARGGARSIYVMDGCLP
jgi:dipeptidyl aminopeptidase/acylaminoacyl peptidase